MGGEANDCCVGGWADGRPHGLCAARMRSHGPAAGRMISAPNAKTLPFDGHPTITLTLWNVSQSSVRALVLTPAASCLRWYAPLTWRRSPCPSH